MKWPFYRPLCCQDFYIFSFKKYGLNANLTPDKVVQKQVRSSNFCEIKFPRQFAEHYF